METVVVSSCFCKHLSSPELPPKVHRCFATRRKTARRLPRAANTIQRLSPHIGKLFVLSSEAYTQVIDVCLRERKLLNSALPVESLCFNIKVAVNATMILPEHIQK